MKELNVLLPYDDTRHTIIYAAGAWTGMLLNDLVDILALNLVDLLIEFLFSELLLGLRAFCHGL